MDKETMLSRRDFLCGATLLAGRSLLVDVAAIAKAAHLDAAAMPYPGSRLEGLVPFVGEIPIGPGKLWAPGLDARLYNDLSHLSSDSLITETDKFYVRTACPDLIDYKKPWTIKVTTPDNETRMLPIEQVKSMAMNMGVHLMECAGNEKGGQFGLISACRWEGVPVTRLLKSMKLKSDVKRVCISGFDRHSQPSLGTNVRKSIPGASWIFTLEQVESTGAFFATKMNGQALPKDHGYPVRLIVPGWYGCTCIKWVDEIWFPDENAEATSQMREFADRTHQSGVPKLARDYKPASIDQAAMPIRVERWNVDGKNKYNVVGILWGGDRPTKNLQIRFRPDEAFVPVENYHQATTATWTLWSHRWTPTSTGVYQIQLKVADATAATKRLDQGYYVRSVDITNV